jgi:hypothetical protein
VFIAPLYSNGSYLSIACIFVVAVMYLPNRCLAVNDCSDFTIPTFGRHVKIYMHPGSEDTFNIGIHLNTQSLLISTPKMETCASETSEMLPTFTQRKALGVRLALPYTDPNVF